MMRYPKVKRMMLTLTVVVAANAAHAASFERGMEAILAEYLKIQTTLAADQTEGVQASAEAIEKLAAQLDLTSAPMEHADHYRSLPQEITLASNKIRQSKDIAAAREAFGELSKPISMWVGMAKPVGKNVMYCPMAKAGWVQEGSKVANPYYGKEMQGCGQIVGGQPANEHRDWRKAP